MVPPVALARRTTSGDASLDRWQEFSLPVRHQTMPWEQDRNVEAPVNERDLNLRDAKESFTFSLYFLYRK